MVCFGSHTSLFFIAIVISSSILFQYHIYWSYSTLCTIIPCRKISICNKHSQILQGSQTNIKYIQCTALTKVKIWIVATVWEKAMAPRSSTLAWKIPWAEESGRLQSTGSRRVRHDWATSLWLFTFRHWRKKWQPLQCFCLENPRDSGAWWDALYGVTHSWTQLKQLSSSSNCLECTIRLACCMECN